VIPGFQEKHRVEGAVIRTAIRGSSTIVLPVFGPLYAYKSPEVAPLKGVAEGPTNLTLPKQLYNDDVLTRRGP
jgi:hypothetical protein